MARRTQYRDDMCYRMYVTDGMMSIGNLNMRWVDMIAKKPKEKRSADEIKNNLKAKIRRMSHGSV